MSASKLNDLVSKDTQEFSYAGSMSFEQITNLKEHMAFKDDAGDEASMLSIDIREAAREELADFNTIFGIQ